MYAKRRYKLDCRIYLEHDLTLQKAVIGMLADHTELFKQFSDNPSFKKWLSDTIFSVTYKRRRWPRAPSQIEKETLVCAIVGSATVPTSFSGHGGPPYGPN